MDMKRIKSTMLSVIFSLLAIFSNASSAAEAASPQTTGQAAIEVDVYKNPTCGCCTHWIENIEKSGMKARIHQPENLDTIKKHYKILPPYQSCHTAVTTQGFVFEGHVPVRYIKQFLANPPHDSIGLAVPGMPLGSPGMEADGQFTPYQVLLLKTDGSNVVYADVASSKDQ